MNLRKSTRRVLSFAAAGAVLLLMLGVPTTRAQDEAKAKPKSLRVYVDTKTLALNLDAGSGRVPLDLSIEVLNALNTTHDGLKIVTEKGVKRVDLRGRFQPVWVAVTDADGKAIAFCITRLPEPVRAAAKKILDSKETDQ